MMIIGNIYIAHKQWHQCAYLQTVTPCTSIDDKDCLQFVHSQGSCGDKPSVGIQTLDPHQSRTQCHSTDFRRILRLRCPMKYWNLWVVGAENRSKKNYEIGLFRGFFSPQFFFVQDLKCTGFQLTSQIPLATQITTLV